MSETYFKKTYLRGDIFTADLGWGVGSEQGGCRPVVIVQNDVGNRFSPTVIVAPISTSIGGKAGLPTHCTLNSNGLSAPSIVLMEQLRTIDKRRLGRYIGSLENGQIVGFNKALAVSVGLMW